jgi:hypothetical protein
MTGLDPAEMIALCGALAATCGLLSARWQHAHLRSTWKTLLQRDALLEFADALRPLLIELRHWGREERSHPPAQQSSTTIGDADSCRPRALDGNAVVSLTWVVERLWMGKLEARIESALVHDAYDEMHLAAADFSRMDAMDRRVNAGYLLGRAEDLLAAIDEAQGQGRPMHTGRAAAHREHLLQRD